jgi:hypothetical protein
MTSILDKIRRAGGTIAVVGGDLRLRVPKGLLSAAERFLLAEHKAEIVRLLAAEPVVVTIIEPDLDEEEVVPPAPCLQCGGSMFWWDLAGGIHCMRCEPAVRSAKIRKQASRIRNRKKRLTPPRPAGGESC